MQLEKKMNTRKFNIGAKFCAKRDKERRDWRGNKEMILSEQETAHLSFQLIKRKGYITKERLCKRQFK